MLKSHVEKRPILILGAGKIGRIIAAVLSDCGDYDVHLADREIPQKISSAHRQNLSTVTLDVTDQASLKKYIDKNNITAIVSCLPYFLNLLIADLAAELGMIYFDLTEDVETTKHIKKLSKTSKAIFVPQCGLAPGFIDIVASNLIAQYKDIEEVKLRCGALPESTSNALQYALNWSVDGLINEYGNPCDALVNSECVELEPLADLESIQIDGLNYEAFNTSGGVGTLVQTYQKSVKNLTYKTIRYPGHCEKMRFLMQGLKLNEDRETLKRILENAIPRSMQDVVIVYVSITGTKNGEFLREAFVKKYYPATLADVECAAIQACTASGACAVIDLVLQEKIQHQSHLKQEEISLKQLLENRFGRYFSE